MTLPSVIDPANWQKLQFEWRTGFENFGTNRRGVALGTGFMIGGSVVDPCPFGVNGFHQIPWENYPVVVEFPDIANDPFFAGATSMKIQVSVSSFFYGPRDVTVAQPCTGLITNYPASMHMFLALGSAEGPIATDPAGVPFEYYFNDRRWSGHKRPWFLGTYEDAAEYRPIPSALPHYWWVLDSGFLENYYPQLAIYVTTRDDALPPPSDPPPLPPPPTDVPPMPGCASGGTPTTVTAGEPSGGVVPMKP